MLLPNDFENEISSRFYDKEITIIKAETEIDIDGGVKKTDNPDKITFLGNARFGKLGMLKNELGLVIDADIVITCDKNTPVELNDTISYLGKRYTVTDTIASDSHLTITGNKC